MKFLYISTGDKYPPDKHLMDGLLENGHDVFELTEKEAGVGKYVRFAGRFRKKRGPYDAIIVGFALPLLVPVVRCMSGKKIIFNAVSSQYEAKDRKSTRLNSSHSQI